MKNSLEATHTRGKGFLLLVTRNMTGMSQSLDRWFTKISYCWELQDSIGTLPQSFTPRIFKTNKKMYQTLRWVNDVTVHKLNYH